MRRTSLCWTLVLTLIAMLALVATSAAQSEAPPGYTFEDGVDGVACRPTRDVQLHGDGVDQLCLVHDAPLGGRCGAPFAPHCGGFPFRTVGP